ncbi:hypothetical protein [Acrocarpospora catenulata]|uniref:hypothetical protein n=1 Tax=Acrocarpospora catenulata TaxID=2836182 RepID=UPI001BDB0E11|nr:hypothetical protein [Acrocarpospora catenulata]
MTLDEIARAGWEDGANDPPLTPTQRTYLIALLGPHIRASIAKRAVASSDQTSTAA